MRYMSEIVKEGGIVNVRIYADGSSRPVALFACAPTAAGLGAIAELLRLAGEGGLGVPAHHDRVPADGSLG